MGLICTMQNTMSSATFLGRDLGLVDGCVRSVIIISSAHCYVIHGNLIVVCPAIRGVFIRWNGMAEWNDGMERWNGIVEWNGGIVE